MFCMTQLLSSFLKLNLAPAKRNPHRSHTQHPFQCLSQARNHSLITNQTGCNPNDVRQVQSCT